MIRSSRIHRRGAATPANEVTGARRRRALSRLAASQRTYDNPANQTLFEHALAGKDVRGTFAIEIGGCRNHQPARALRASGFSRILRVDPQAADPRHRAEDDDVVSTIAGDARSLEVPSGTVDVVVYNQSLAFVEAWASGGPERANAIPLAMREAFRALKPGGWVLIKPGSYVSGVDRRDEEGAAALRALEKSGFREIDVVTIRSDRLAHAAIRPSRGTSRLPRFDLPVFIWARKPIRPARA